MKKLIVLLFVIFMAKADTLFVSDSTILSCGYDPALCKYVPIGRMKYCGQKTKVFGNGNIEVTLRIYHKVSRFSAIAYESVYEKNSVNGFIWQNNDTVEVIDGINSPIYINWSD